MHVQCSTNVAKLPSLYLCSVQLRMDARTACCSSTISQSGTCTLQSRCPSATLSVFNYRGGHVDAFPQIHCAIGSVVSRSPPPSPATGLVRHTSTFKTKNTVVENEKWSTSGLREATNTSLHWRWPVCWINASWLGEMVGKSTILKSATLRCTVSFHVDYYYSTL